MNTQKNKILKWLLRGRKLTPLAALEKFQCLCLSSRIRDLRKEGHDIKTRMIKTATGKWVAEYSL